MLNTLVLDSTNAKYSAALVIRNNETDRVAVAYGTNGFTLHDLHVDGKYREVGFVHFTSSCHVEEMRNALD